LKSRKKIDIYNALDIKKKYYAIFKLDTKNKFIMKNADELQILLNSLISLKEHNFKYKFLFITSEICSKSKEYLTTLGWKIHIKKI